MNPVLTYTFGDIVRAALKNARIIPSQQAVSAKDLANGIEAGNDVLKHWQAQGLHLWTKTEAIVLLNTGQRKYVLGPEGDEVARADSFVSTRLSNAQFLADNILTLDDISGIEGAPNLLTINVTASAQEWTATNNGILSVSSGLVIANGSSGGSAAQLTINTEIGKRYIVTFGYTVGSSSSATFRVFDSAGTLDTRSESTADIFTLEFTARDLTATFEMLNDSVSIGDTSTTSEINFIDKDNGDRIGVLLDDGVRFWSSVAFVTSTVQIADGLTGPVEANSSVYSYSEAIDRPIRILDGRYGDTVISTEIPSEQWSREEYFEQPDKDSSGTVVQWYYSPQVNNGELYVWQVASSACNVFRFTYERPIEISESQVDDVDIPSEWVLPLKWAIAAELGPQYGVPLDRQAVLEGKAANTLQLVLGHDVERSSMQIQPNFN